MVLTSQVRGGCSSAAIPDVEVRQELEIDNPAEIDVCVSITCEEDLHGRYLTNYR